jgi:hypothetical protein
MDAAGALAGVAAADDRDHRRPAPGGAVIRHIGVEQQVRAARVGDAATVQIHLAERAGERDAALLDPGDLALFLFFVASPRAIVAVGDMGRSPNYLGRAFEQLDTMQPRGP